MNSSEDDLRFELHLVSSRGESTMSWDLDTFTDTSSGKFIVFDEEGDPRLILDAEDLIEMQLPADEKVVR